MEKWILIIFLVLLVVVTIALLVVLYFMRKGFRFVKRMYNGEITDEDFERLAKKNYQRKESPSFDSDYFKGTGRQQSSQQPKQRRTTRTADGVTIVDQRDPNKTNKKIFAQNEGEYVDFVEEK